MFDVSNGILVNNAQHKRVAEHPVQIKSECCLIIVDNLEAGFLRIYEHYGNSVNIQQLFSKYGKHENHVLLAEVIINSSWKNDGIFIHKIICEYGHEYLIQPIIYQILHFAYFYQYHIIGISEREFRNCYPYAKEILSDFKMVNLIYEYSL